MKKNVYNLEVNTYYNYFANSYLIHNGAPCSACNACGGGLSSLLLHHIYMLLIIMHDLEKQLG